MNCAAEVVLILDTSGSMSGYRSTNINWMLQIAENFPVGQEYIRVSMMLVYNTYSILWDLDSQYTSNSDTLADSLNNNPTDEAQRNYIYLTQSLSLAHDTILSNARSGVARVVIMFWDGDHDLSTNVAGFDEDIR